MVDLLMRWWPLVLGASGVALVVLVLLQDRRRRRAPHALVGFDGAGVVRVKNDDDDDNPMLAD